MLDKTNLKIGDKIWRLNGFIPTETTIFEISGEIISYKSIPFQLYGGEYEDTFEEININKCFLTKLDAINKALNQLQFLQDYLQEEAAGEIKKWSQENQKNN